MYLIKKIDFDNYENEIDCAILDSIIGVLQTEEAAIEYIIEALRKVETYKGWDGNEYPYYEKQYIKDLSKEM